MTALKRRTDWLDRLQRELEAAADRPHQWGRHDCALWCARCIHAMTGADFAKGLRGRYRSERGAFRVLSEYGGLEGLVTHFLGEPVGPICARRGDVLIGPFHERDDGTLVDVFAICVGHKGAAPGADGLRLHEIGNYTKAWRVG